MVRRLNESVADFSVQKLKRLAIVANSLKDNANYYVMLFDKSNLSKYEDEFRAFQDAVDEMVDAVRNMSVELDDKFDALYQAAKKDTAKGGRVKESIDKSDLVIDMWYGDSFNKRDYAVTCTFYPNEGEYRGNIYRLSDGKCVGDYSCSDSVVIERELGYDFG